MNLPDAIDALDQLREYLGAFELRGTWHTDHGLVAVIVSTDAPVITVDGEHVPMTKGAT